MSRLQYSSQLSNFGKTWASQSISEGIKREWYVCNYQKILMRNRMLRCQMGKLFVHFTVLLQLLTILYSSFMISTVKKKEYLVGLVMILLSIYIIITEYKTKPLPAACPMYA
jgi:hypothetical protein